MSTKLTCKFCKQQFDQPKCLYEHLQSQHSAPKDNLTCPICGVLCSKYEAYRDHLLYIHGQCNEGQKLTFKTLNEFLQWKASLEMKYNCTYILQSAPKVLSNNEKKYFYYCDRANSGQKDRKSVTFMKSCSSVITVVEGTGVFKVEYWDTHSGHNQTSVPIHKDELENAISSVEMVQAIAENDDSIDRVVQYIVTENDGTVPEIIPEKSNFVTSGQNNKSVQNVKKSDASRKRSSLFSLASVACGKGISKKPLNKSNTEKGSISEKTSTDQVVSKSTNSNPSADKSSEVQKNQLMCLASAATTVTTTVATTLTSTSLVSSLATKIAAAQPPLAPKGGPIPNDVPMNSLLTPNNNFQNQFVIVNSVTAGQTTVNSGQNVFTSGQNILLSLGSLGQNIIPTSGSVSKSQDQVYVANDKNSPVSVSSMPKIGENLNLSTTSTSLLKTGLHVTSSSLPTNTVSTSSSSINLATDISSAPVILSSLPVGSTFMSVNNNLIPIATPSGTFLPTNLPPNIVLAPVMPSPVTPNRAPLPKAPLTTASNTPVLQSQPRLSHPSTVAITVSSMVKEPLYSTSVAKQTSTVSSVVSNTINTPKIKSVQESRTPPVTTASETTSIVNKATAFKRQQARKRTVKSILSSQRLPPSENIDLSPSVAQVTNSSLNIAPISPIPVPIPKPHKPGTLVFESSGDVYMLEPVESDIINTSLNSLKSVLNPDPLKIMIDRSVQTVEDLSSEKLKTGRKRVSDDGDSSVLLKVKYYQLEMKYLSRQTECKQLKLDLIKEKLKNAELTGQRVEGFDLEPGMNKAEEIMKEIEERYSENKGEHIYTLTKTSVLRSLYDDLEDLCMENKELHQELERYRSHDKFYKNLKRKLDDDEF